MAIAGELEQRILRNTEDSVNKMASSGGSTFLAAVTAHANLTGYAVVIHTDAVFTKFYVNGVDATARYTPSGVTRVAGTYIKVPNGSIITDITMSSGDCDIYDL